MQNQAITIAQLREEKYNTFLFELAQRDYENLKQLNSVEPVPHNLDTEDLYIQLTDKTSVRFSDVITRDVFVFNRTMEVLEAPFSFRDQVEQMLRLNLQVPAISLESCGIDLKNCSTICILIGLALIINNYILIFQLLALEVQMKENIESKLKISKDYLSESLIQNIWNEIEAKDKDQVLVFSEGGNFLLLNKAKEFFAPNMPIRFFDGGGKGNLKIIHKQLQKSIHKTIFIFDSDAKSDFDLCSTSSTAIQYLIPVNESNKITNGIENLFDEVFFDFTSSYYKTSIKDGKQIVELNKKQFTDFILERNSIYDFVNFKSIFTHIQTIINS
jgi:hypothetical protein